MKFNQIGQQVNLKFLKDSKVNCAIPNYDWEYFFLIYSQWKSVKFTEAELAVRLLYMLGEAIPVNQGNHFIGDQARAEIMRDLMRTVS